ncbi:helix-turn-helix domain-containing protein [uncultured Sphingomonas sp.]|uniref:AraC family transcriptional regulator n=1 Tax=uncultured Sphingomonas sp. TaxID=158754 RepID=UPI0035CAE021
MARLFGAADLVLLEALFDALPDSPFFVKDTALRYVAANRAMARLCGAPRPDALIGRTVGDFFPRQLAIHYEALDRQVFATGRAITSRLDLSRANRIRPAWLIFSRIPVRDAAGRIIGVAASARRLDRPDRRHPVYQRLAAAAERIRADPARPLALSRLAAGAGVSRSQFDRDFRRVFGVSPQAFHAQARIEHALFLLRGDARVCDVAQACGFSDQSAFSRRFRALIGMSPRAWRAMAAGEAADETA